MSDPLGAWQAAGTEWVMLPSGVEVRIEPVPLVELVRSGFLPAQLRLLALRLIGGREVQEPSPEEVATAADLERRMISRWVSGFRWICPCPECQGRRGDPLPEQAFDLTPEVLGAEPPLVPRVDQVALSDLVHYARSPRQVDALSRLTHGLLEAPAAGRIIQEEEPNTLAGWSSFRDGGRGLDPVAPSPDVRGPALGVPRPNRASRRAGARRGPGTPAVAGGAEPPVQRTA